ncbi:phosphohydrolase [bacterium]|nr:phosphohydrolase [bacterium]
MPRRLSNHRFARRTHLPYEISKPLQSLHLSRGSSPDHRPVRNQAVTMINQQISFLTAADALKTVERQTSPIGLTRKENSAEHSWQVILAATVLAPHSAEPIDLLRVIKMLSIHDLPEIECGDVFHYAKDQDPDLPARELDATKRILSHLPIDQAQEFLALWQEFEARETPEAKFAHAVDRLMAFIMNQNNQGGTWVEHQLTAAQVLDKNSHVAEGSSAIFELIQQIVANAARKGWLSE